MGIVYEHVRVTDDDEECLGPGDGHVKPSGLEEQTNTVGRVVGYVARRRTHRRHDDNLLLLALIVFRETDPDTRVAGSSEHLAESNNVQLKGRNDTNRVGGEGGALGTHDALHHLHNLDALHAIVPRGRLVTVSLLRTHDPLNEQGEGATTAEE